MPPRPPGEPASTQGNHVSSSVNSVVQQWERRAVSPWQQQQQQSRVLADADVGIAAAQPRRLSLPPPRASSSGAAGVRVSIALPARQSSDPPLSHATMANDDGQHGGYVTPSYTYGPVEDEVSDNENDEKRMLNAHAPSLPSQAFAVPAATNIYVGGTSTLNHDPLPPAPPVYSSAWWPTWALWPIAQVACMRLANYAVHAALINVLVWIPGLVAIACYDALHVRYYARPTFVGVGLLWWSAWLSAVYAAAWACWLLAIVVPKALSWVSRTLTTSSEIARLVTYVDLTRRYLAMLLWSLCVWILFLSLVWQHFPGHEGISATALDPLAKTTSQAASGNGGDQSTTNSIVGTLFAANTTSSPAGQTAVDASHVSRLIHISRFLFAVVLSCALLWAQKMFIQSVANSFHLVTLADRIKQLQDETSLLIALYANAKNKPVVAPVPSHRRSELGGTDDEHAANDDVISLVRKISGIGSQKLRDVLSVHAPHARTSIDVKAGDFHTTAAAITAEPPFLHSSKHDSPAVFVEQSLETLYATRALARRIFQAYAVAKSASPSSLRSITGESLQHAFGDTHKRTAKRAFAVLDRDRNGDCTWEECMQACVAIHRERMCLLASMHDVDSAVARLDVILRGLVVTVSLIIIAALFSARFSNLVSSLGTMLLGLSWLVSSTAQESLASVVWVFCKHPIDVGDVIVVPGLLSGYSSSSTLDPLARLQGCTDGDTFVVEEVQLMSTVLRTTSSSKHVQVANYILAQKPLVNLRRSGPVDEPFVLSVAYDTPLTTIERVRFEMAAWVATQRRDFRSGIEVAIEALDDQAQMRLVLNIRYKSDWQNTALRLRRRNRWISALKQVLASNGVRGSASKGAGGGGGDKGGGKVQAFDLMDSLPDCTERQRRTCRDDEEVNDDDDDDDDINKTVVSRLHPALHPAAPAVYRQHAASSTQLSPVLATSSAAWRTHSQHHQHDIELGKRS